MRILIAGAGTIGSNLAVSLANEGQEVVVVDTDERRLAGLQAGVDCQTLCASATSPTVLEELGIRRTDLVVAVTQSDAVNLMVCALAEFYRVGRKLARIRDPELGSADSILPPEHFGADHFISPEGITVAQIERLVRCPGTTEAVDFEQGRFLLRALPITEDCTVAGSTLMEVHQHLGGGFLISAVRRGSRVHIPEGGDRLRIGDTVYIATTPAVLPRVINELAPLAQPARKVLIFGGGVAGRQLAERLRPHVPRITVIEPDAAAASHAAEQLDDFDVEVLHGSVLDEALLARCHVDTADFLICLSGDDEENFMGALLFRKYSNGTPIVLTNQPHYVDILDLAGLDIVINPRLLAVSQILRYIRGHTVMSVTKLHTEEAEILQLRAAKGSPVTRKPIRDLGLPQHGLLIVAVNRDGDVTIPSGDFLIGDDDQVMVFADQRGIGQVGAFFR